MTTEDKYAVVIPQEASLTAPLAASVELTKLYINAAKKLNQLENEIWTENITDDDGNIIRTITHIPPDYKWLLEYLRKIGSDIAKTNAQMETKNTDQKLQLLNIFMQSDSVSRELKDKLVEEAIKKKVIPVKNKDREW